MKRPLLGLSVLGATALANPAFADIEPAEVWDGMKAYIESFGYEVTANVSGGGDSMTVEDMIIIMNLPEEEATVAIEMGAINLDDAGDAVKVTFESSFPISFNINGDGETVSGVVGYDQTGFEVLVSGAPEDMTYAYTAESLTMSLDELEVDGTAIGRDVLRFDFTANSVSGETRMVTGAERDLIQSSQIGDVTFDFFATDIEDSNTTVQAKGSVADLVSSGKSVLPLQGNIEDMAAMMQDGMEFVADIKTGATEVTVNVVEDGEAVAIDFDAQGGTFDMDFSEEGLSYNTVSTGMNFEMSGAEIPFPIALSAEEYGLGLAMPLGKLEEASDVGLKFKLGNFTMSDLLWNIFDPGKALPRDPATLAFDIQGKAKMLFNIFDPEEAAAIENAEMPAELESLALKELVFDAVGTKLTGDGEFTFDNTDLESFDGFPRPEGKLDLNLTGANKLMDTLVSMGLVPEDQVMGARMMMGMFGRSVGEDAISSTIEINDEGHVLANGIRIQ